VRQRRGKQAGGLVETIIVRKIVGAILVILVVCIVVGALLVWKPQIDPVETAKASAFNSGLVAKGAELAAIGNCAVCHTAPGGKSYAGSRPLPIPFGTIYSSNITPDSETGIGNWSEGAFRRALRDGVDRKGRHLYPAFPYDHFTHLTDDDIRALYAFIITREPAHSVPLPTNCRSPTTLVPFLLVGSCCSCSAVRAMTMGQTVRNGTEVDISWRACDCQATMGESRRILKVASGVMRKR
jgi:mono/diheme cytochrome c family protein